MQHPIVKKGSAAGKSAPAQMVPTAEDDDSDEDDDEDEELDSEDADVSDGWLSCSNFFDSIFFLQISTMRWVCDQD